MINVPIIPVKYYPAMLTVSLILIVLGIFMYTISRDNVMLLLGGFLIGLGISGLLINIYRWNIENYNKK